MKKARALVKNWAVPAIVALLGVICAVGFLHLVKPVRQDVGPYQAVKFSLRFGEGTILGFPPAGTIEFPTHTGPIGIRVQYDQLRLEGIERFAGLPNPLIALTTQAAEETEEGVYKLLVQSAIAGFVGAFLFSLIAWRNWKKVLAGTSLAAVAVAGATIVGWATYHPETAFNEPRYTGMLTAAPRLVGKLELRQNRLKHYQKQLQQIVAGGASLYLATGGLPEVTDGEITTILLVSDIHSQYSVYETVETLIDQFQVDAVIDAGDLTQWGLSFESRAFAGIGSLGVPYLFVKGNHDSETILDQVALIPNVVVLDKRPVDIVGLRILGGPDPLFTPDAQKRDEPEAEKVAVAAAGQELADIARADGHIDLAVVHNPIAAQPFAGIVPLVLAGHWHKRELSTVDGTLIYDEGSSGGSGFYSLANGAKPEPLQMSMLHFDAATHRLVAYDQVDITGLGQTGMTITREVVGSNE